MSEKVYAAITNKIIEALEAGVVPWSMPWDPRAAWPINLSTGKYYRGWNVFELSWTMMSQGWSHNIWGSYKQWEKVGGKVRKGEHSQATVLFHKVYRKREYNEDTGEYEDRVSYISPRFSPVFNVAQVDGVDEKVAALLEKLGTPNTEIPVHELGERVPEAIGVDVRFAGGQAYYSPSWDSITLPARESFKSQAGFYGTLFHECGHATGASTRLNRPELVNGANFGSNTYSREELTAEIYSVFLGSILGTETDPKFANSTSYIASWLSVLKNDRKLIIDASKDAETAVKWTLDKLGITEYTEDVEIDQPLEVEYA